RATCARLAVMYLGKIVELGETATVFRTPRHPYTQSLLAAVPMIGGRRGTLDFALAGEPPNPREVPTGRRFRPRRPLPRERGRARGPAAARGRHPARGLSLRVIEPALEGPDRLDERQRRDRVGASPIPIGGEHVTPLGEKEPSVGEVRRRALDVEQGGQTV